MKFHSKRFALILCTVFVFMSVMLAGCGSDSSSSAENASSTIAGTSTDTSVTTNESVSTSETTKDETGTLASTSTKAEKTGSTQTAVVSGTKIFENTKYGIKFAYPEAWEKRDGSGNVLAAFVINQKDPSKVASLSVSVEELPSDITLEDYSKATLPQLEKAVSGVKIQSKNNITIAGCKAQSIEFTGEQQGITLKFLSTFLVKDKKAYIIQFGGTSQAYSAYLPEVQNLYKSITLK